MAIRLHRSPRVEALVEALAQSLLATRPDDPFAPVPIVVGSRGMEQHLRHALATKLGIFADAQFLFPGNAFATAAEAIEKGLPTIPWSSSDRRRDPWRGAPFVFRVLQALRELQSSAGFERIGRYLAGDFGPDPARELRFAEDVAGCLEKLEHDRPDDARDWARRPEAAPIEHRWLAMLMQRLAAGCVVPAPSARLHRVEQLAARERRQALHVFGLSTLRPGDKRWLSALARHLDVHLYLLVPSHCFLDEHRSPASRVRAIREATDPDERQRLIEDLEANNELLSANAGPSRDVQGWLNELVVDDRELDETPADQPRGLLDALQGWVHEALDNPRGVAPDWVAALESEPGLPRGVTSIEIHRSHGALRQCEVLRDALLRRFSLDPTLEPRDVLVMTPDLATYAPLLSAVLSREPALPVQVHDLGLKSSNPLAELALMLLRLPTERVTASMLLELAGQAGVRERFDLSADDVSSLRTDVCQSNLRWAWDAADREGHDQPALSSHTVAFGLDRMALGVLMDTEEVVVADEPRLAAEVPTREAAVRIGRFARFVRTLRASASGLSSARSPGRWKADLIEAVDALAKVEGDRAWIRARFVEGLSEALPEEIDESLELEGAALTALLERAFDLPIRESAGRKGAVQITGLEPLRSIPFRVVAIVGLDDRAFPRTSQLPSWDPFSESRPGEHARSVIDRHLFIEALLCARDALCLVGCGFEPTGNEAVSMSLVAEELVHLLSRGLPPKRLETSGVHRNHALQPWSPASFTDVRTATLDPRFQAASIAMGLEAKNPPARRDGSAGLQVGLASSQTSVPWPADEKSMARLTIDAIARALCEPQRELLGRRLNLDLDLADDELPDREPIEQSPLESGALRRRVLDLFESGEFNPESNEDRARLLRRLQAEGALPIRAGGERTIHGIWEDVREVVSAAATLGGPVKLDPKVLSAQVGDTVLEAHAGDVRTGLEEGPTLVVTGSGKSPKERDLLRAFLTLLVGRVAGEPWNRAVCVWADPGKSSAFVPPSVEEASRLLSSYVEAYKRVRAGPVLLFPSISQSIAKSCRAEGKSVEVAIEKAASEWTGSSHNKAVRDGEWVAPLYGHWSIDELTARAAELGAEAERVWGPLLQSNDAAKEGKSGKGKGRA